MTTTRIEQIIAAFHVTTESAMQITEQAVDQARAKIAPALSAFDVLPDSSLVRLPVLEGLFACSAASIWRRVRVGTLPKPVKLSPRVTAWRVGDLREILRQAA